MKTLVKIDESDFEYETSDGRVIPVLDFGNDSEYYITYGHIPFEEMEEHVRDLMAEYDILEEGQDFSELSWRWAIAFTAEYTEDEFELRWQDISPDDNGAFPITLLTVW